MDLKSLNYFVAAYEEGNITAAAKRCHISQPSISSAIAALEDHLSVTLFGRHKKGVTPTHDGERLYQAARKLLSDANSIQAMFQCRPPAERLAIGIMSALNVAPVMKLLNPLFVEHERYDIRITRADEACDIRIVCEADKKPQEEFIELWQEDFVVAIPEGHPLAIKEELFILDLQAAPLIVRDYCSTSLLDAAHMAGISFNIVATAFSEEWAIALVNEGVGIAILPQNYIRPEHKIVARHFSNMTPQRKVGIAYARDKGLPQVVQDICSTFAL